MSSTPREDAKAWLRSIGRADIADRFEALEALWRKDGKATRRNWWDVLAGAIKSVHGENFPVFAHAQRRKGLQVTSDAIQTPDALTIDSQDRDAQIDHIQPPREPTLSTAEGPREDPKQFSSIGGVLAGHIRAIISAEENTRRFEHFCVEVLSAELGESILVTSANYDRGKDGRSIGDSQVIVAVSVAKGVDKKAHSDVLSLTKRRKTPTTLYFCSSQELTEDLCDKLKGELQPLVGSSWRIEILGLIQLSHLAVIHSEVSRAHYQAELHQIREALKDDRDDIGFSHFENRSLSLALCTMGSRDGAELRATLVNNILLQVLSDEPLTLREIAKAISSLLRLQTSVSTTFFHGALSESPTLFSRHEERWALTAQGRVQLSHNLDDIAPNMVMAGMATIREELDQALATSLTDDQHMSIWTAIRQGLSALLHSHGAEVLAYVSRVLGEGNDGLELSVVVADPSVPEAETIALRIAKDAGLRGSASPEQQIRIAEALRGLIGNSYSETFRWLAHLSAVYTAICSLGIEHYSRKQVQRAVVRFNFLLDTDIALDYLCEGEPRHEEVLAFCSDWQRLAGC